MPPKGIPRWTAESALEPGSMKPRSGIQGLGTHHDIKTEGSSKLIRQQRQDLNPGSKMHGCSLQVSRYRRQEADRLFLPLLSFSAHFLCARVWGTEFGTAAMLTGTGGRVLRRKCQADIEHRNWVWLAFYPYEPLWDDISQPPGKGCPCGTPIFTGAEYSLQWKITTVFVSFLVFLHLGTRLRLKTKMWSWAWLLYDSRDRIWYPVALTPSAEVAIFCPRSSLDTECSLLVTHNMAWGPTKETLGPLLCLLSTCSIHGVFQLWHPGDWPCDLVY